MIEVTMFVHGLVLGVMIGVVLGFLYAAKKFNSKSKK
jgi:hypothetical protein